MAEDAMNAPSARKTSGLAITSFVLGVLGLCCPIFLSLPAIICGHIARGNIKRSGGAEDGGGLALAGTILGYISLALGILGCILLGMFGGKLASLGELGTDMMEAQKIHSAVVQMVSDGEAKGDTSLGWPADAGITTVTELKKRLTDNGYLTAAEASTLDFGKFEFGNVSDSDPAETIFIKFKTEIVPGASIYLAKDGEEGGIADDDTSNVPARTPAYLAP
jgi:hypothetical protein